MRDVSLHILDLMENSIRAGASVVSLTLRQDAARDLLTIALCDNGPGLPVAPEIAADPFFTTKSGKRVGLGLSLFKAAAERAGGRLALGKARLGGLKVAATMRLSHVDRSPLGDVAATLATVAAANPGLEIRFEFACGKRRRRVETPRIRRALPDAGRDPLAVARILAEKVNHALLLAELL